MRKLFTVVAAIILATAPLAAQQEKMRVAVLDFDYATVKTDVAAIFGSDQDVGKGITDLLIDKLWSTATSIAWSIAEPPWPRSLAEQEFLQLQSRRSQHRRAHRQAPRRAGHYRRQHHAVRPR